MASARIRRPSKQRVINLDTVGVTGSIPVSPTTPGLLVRGGRHHRGCSFTRTTADTSRRDRAGTHTVSQTAPGCPRTSYPGPRTTTRHHGGPASSADRIRPERRVGIRCLLGSPRHRLAVANHGGLSTPCARVVAVAQTLSALLRAFCDVRPRAESDGGQPDRLASRRPAWRAPLAAARA